MKTTYSVDIFVVKYEDGEPCEDVEVTATREFSLLPEAVQFAETLYEFATGVKKRQRELFAL